MSYTSLVRARAEALITGETGTDRTMTAARFTRAQTAKRETDDTEAQAAERTFKVRVRETENMLPVNTADGFKFQTLAVNVEVAYTLTDAGDDMVEGVTPMHGAGTVTAVEDRSSVDANDIEYVLDWYVNWSSLDASVAVIWCRRVGGTSLETEGSVATLTVPFEVLAQVTQTTLAP